MWMAPLPESDFKALREAMRKVHSTTNTDKSCRLWVPHWSSSVPSNAGLPAPNTFIPSVIATRKAAQFSNRLGSCCFLAISRPFAPQLHMILDRNKHNLLLSVLFVFFCVWPVTIEINLDLMQAIWKHENQIWSLAISVQTVSKIRFWSEKSRP